MAIDLSWITDELAIGGALRRHGAARLAIDHGVGAVIDMRAEACDDAAVLADQGIALLHVPTRDLCAVDAGALRTGVAFAIEQLERNRTVLVHCQHGIGRSAIMGLSILVARGHAPLSALELAKQRRALVSPSPAQFAAWARWLDACGHAAPSFDRLAAIAYRHLGAG
ncbi:MAG: dual specificity protein phosphatase family protein [Kofleriaceae bacterium]